MSYAINPFTGKFDNTGGGGSQTPWTADVDAANYSLNNFWSLNGSARLSVGNVSTASITWTDNNPTGAYPKTTGTLVATIYAYKVDSYGHKVYSTGGKVVQRNMGVGANKGYLAISWSAVTGATGYRITQITDPTFGGTANQYHLDVPSSQTSVNLGQSGVAGKDDISGNSYTLGTDRTPKRLGGDITAGLITAEGVYSNAGVTATYFFGDGSNITNLPQSPLTPWISDIDGGGFNLNNVGAASFASGNVGIDASGFMTLTSAGGYSLIMASVDGQHYGQTISSTYPFEYLFDDMTNSVRMLSLSSVVGNNFYGSQYFHNGGGLVTTTYNTLDDGLGNMTLTGGIFLSNGWFQGDSGTSPAFSLNAANGGVFIITDYPGSSSPTVAIAPTVGSVTANSFIINGSNPISFLKADGSLDATVYQPSALATVDLTSQSAAITATTLYTPTVGGMYRISITLQVTRAATTSSVLGGATGVVITYTDSNNNIAQSIVPLLTSQTGAVIVPASGNVGNSTTTQSQGSANIYAKTGVAIKYAVGYTSVGATSMQYAYHLRAEQVK